MHLSRTEQNIGTTISCFAFILFFLYLLFGILGTGDEMFVLSCLGAVVILCFVLCFSVQYRLRKQSKIAEIDYLNIGTQRHFLGLFMVFYGVPKLFGNFFDYQLFALDSKLIEVSEFELAWYYFGKSNWQELVSGILEFVPGILLFHRRTYYVAALVLLFVTSQVFILNLFFRIGGVTLPAATILLACNVYIIYSQKPNIIQFFKNLNFSNNPNFGRKTRIVVKAFKYTALFLVLFVIYIKAKPAIWTGNYQSKYQELVGKYSLETIARNNVAYQPANDSSIYKDLYIEKQSRWNILRRCDNKLMAFVLEIRSKNDSLRIYLNRGGTGDSPDIIDTASALRGTYTLKNNRLMIRGIQLKDTLDLVYIKQDLKAKGWFW